MQSPAISSSAVQSAIGALMRLYRASPFCPRFGPALGKLLALATGNPTQILIREIAGTRFELDLREVIDASLFYSGTFEANAETTITASLEPGMMALDIGANFGYHTFRMANAVGPGGKVVAIEPTNWAFCKLQRNLALNPVYKNILPLRVAIGDHDQDQAELRIKSNYRLDGTDPSIREAVPLHTLDAIVREIGLGRVDFIKIDVDGFEGKVVRGARTILSADRPTLFFEITPSAMRANGDDPEELIKELVGLGYDLRTEKRKSIANIGAYLARFAPGQAVNLFAACRG